MWGRYFRRYIPLSVTLYFVLQVTHESQNKPVQLAYRVKHERDLVPELPALRVRFFSAFGRPWFMQTDSRPPINQ